MTTAVSPVLGWMRTGTALFHDTLAGLDDGALTAPAALPGWSRAHVAAHVGLNAAALARLCRWARTGVRNPMYDSPEQRDAEIAEGATLAPGALRALVAAGRDALDAEFAAMDEAAWATTVVTAQSRSVPARETVWMRVREVWVHAVDLGAGICFEDFPAELHDALVTDVVTTWQRRGQGPALRVGTHDGRRSWTVALPGHAPSELRGPAAELTAVLTGRLSRPGDPQLGRWL